MEHSIGEGLSVAALAAAFVAYFYFKHQTRLRRLELIHAERLVAMDKGVPLPELPIDPPPVPRGEANADSMLLAGFLLIAAGGGTMIAFSLIDYLHVAWPLPLPLVLMGLGFVLYRVMPRQREP